MAGKQKTDYPPRTFVKEQKDGPPLTRTVTTPSTEVAATYDGYAEQATGSKTPAGPGGGATAGKQPSSSS